MLRPLPARPERILVVRLGSIGDVVRVLPMLNGLEARFPDAAIDWIVQAKAADVLLGHPQIDRLFVVPFTRWREALGRGAWKLAREVRVRNHDLVLDFQGMLKGALWARVAAPSGVRVGWGPGHTKNLSWLAYHGLRYPSGRAVNRHLRHRVLVDWLGVPDLAARPIDFDDVERVEPFLRSLADRPRPWILGYPGSSTAGSHKRWDPARLEAALRGLRDRTGGTVLVGWGPAEEAEALSIAEALGAPLIPPTSIRELAHVLSRCDLFIGMDTGPMHLASLVGTPVVAVFGRSSPVVHGPADHLPGVAVAGPEARDWPTRERRGLAPFTEPDPAEVVEAALAVLTAAGPPRAR